MRGFLIQDVLGRRQVGLDFVIWSQLRIALCGTSRAELGVAVLNGASADPELARPFVEVMHAHMIWENARRELLGHPAFSDHDHVAAFRAYRKADAELQALAQAVVAGMALERSLNAHGYMVPMHDAIAAECNMVGVGEQTLRELWEPTPELLGRLPREQLLAIAEPYVAPAAIESWAKVRASDLAGKVAAVLSGASNSIATMNQKIWARQWVHPLLRFLAPGQPAAPVDAAAAIVTDDDMLERAAS